jgi:hypothetical protein
MHDMGGMGQSIVYHLTLYGTKEDEHPEDIEIRSFFDEGGFLDTGNVIVISGDGTGIKSRRRTGRKRKSRKRKSRKRKSRKYRKKYIIK